MTTIFIIIAVILLIILAIIVEIKPKRVVDGLGKIDVLFAPEKSGEIVDRIVKEIELSNKNIDVAIFDLTERDIAKALVKAKNKGVKIRLILDSKPADGEYSQCKFLEGEGLNIKKFGGENKGWMHHKFAIFDDRLLLTGSRNWTWKTTRGWDNVLFISDHEVLDRYKKEFEKIWEEK